MKLLIFLSLMILVAPVTAESEAGGDFKLHLNNGEKWVADAHTSNSIQQMENILLGVAETTSDAEGARKTGALLQAEVNRLIAGCRMTGPSHDQLHLYLNRLVPAINKLASVSSSNLAAENYASVRTILMEYNDYFQTDGA